MILWFWLFFLVFSPPTFPPSSDHSSYSSLPQPFPPSFYSFPPYLFPFLLSSLPQIQMTSTFFNASIAFLGTEAQADNAAGIVSPALQPLGQDDYNEGGSHGFFVDLRFWIFYFDPSLLLTATSCRFLLPVAGGLFLACCGIAFYFIKKYRSLFWLLCGW